MHKDKIAIMIPALSGGGAEKVAADLSIYFEKIKIIWIIQYMNCF